jgi:hypothetical protein
MKLLPGILLLITASLALASDAAKASREETLVLFENRKVYVQVPAGLAYQVKKDLMGAANIRLTEPDEKVTLTLTLIPDPEGTFANARARTEKMFELFNAPVDESTEKAMQFEELEPRTGAGTYCVYTDAKLVGKTELPPGEFRHLTVGIKAWPGVAAIFELFSQSTSSPEYQAVMKMLRESVEEKPGPLR